MDATLLAESDIHLIKRIRIAFTHNKLTPENYEPDFIQYMSVATGELNRIRKAKEMYI